MYSAIARPFYPLRRLPKLIVLIPLLLWLLLSPAITSALVGLGGYVSELTLGDGTNEVLYLGDGTSEMLVLGSGPVISTLPATSVSMTGGGRATLQGNLTSLNGMPRADVWFVWGYSASALTNSTSATTVFGTGAQSTTLTGFGTKRNVYYQFRASTDGTSSGAIVSFVADKGFNLLETVLPIVIALSVLVFTFLLTGSPVAAMFGSIIGLVAFYIVKAMLEAIK